MKDIYKVLILFRMLTFVVRIPTTYGVAIPDRHPIPFTNAIIVGE